MKTEMLLAQSCYGIRSFTLWLNSSCLRTRVTETSTVQVCKCANVQVCKSLWVTESVIAGSMGRTALPSRSRALSAGACGYTGKGDCVDRSCVGENSLDNLGGLSVSTEEKQEDSCQCQGDAGSGSCCLFLGLKTGKNVPEKGSMPWSWGKGEMWAAPHRPQQDPLLMTEHQSFLHKFVWVLFPPPFPSLSPLCTLDKHSTIELQHQPLFFQTRTQ